MLFMFYTVLHIFVLQTNAFNIKREETIEENEDISKSNETVTEKIIITHDQNYYLNVIKNSRNAPNLKSNVFDKMLSNEMLSIKQHMYEKDVKSSSVYLSFKNNVPTPTLEINQKWPIDKLMSVTSVPPNTDAANSDTAVGYSLSNKKQSSDGTKINQSVYEDENLNMEGTKNKIIEVRSFSVMPIQTSEGLHLQQAKRQCTCARHNHHTICSHRGIGAQINTENICTHTEKYLTMSPECTRTEDYSVSLTYFPYFVYPSFFLGITTEAYRTYYHPDIINDLKLPKRKKHRKTKKPYVEEGFFSEIDGIEDDNDENQYDYSDSNESDDEAVNKQQKKKYKLNSKLYNINYDNSAKADSDLVNKVHAGYIKVIDSDKFVQDIIEDLKVHYNDAVIKDCYCSLSTFNYTSKIVLIYIITMMFVL